MSLASAYGILIVAVVFEVCGTSALLASEHFTRPMPTVMVFVCYAAALASISLTFRAIPMGIVYAIWSGLGIVLIVAVGWLGFGQRPDLPGAIGLGLILLGVVVINLFSNSPIH
jgi:small multidrug resistance pump